MLSYVLIFAASNLLAQSAFAEGKVVHGHGQYFRNGYSFQPNGASFIGETNSVLRTSATYFEKEGQVCLQADDRVFLVCVSQVANPSRSQTASPFQKPTVTVYMPSARGEEFPLGEDKAYSQIETLDTEISECFESTSDLTFPIERVSDLRDCRIKIKSQEDSRFELSTPFFGVVWMNISYNISFGSDVNMFFTANGAGDSLELSEAAIGKVLHFPY